MPAYLCLLLSLGLAAFAVRSHGGIQLVFSVAAALAALAVGWVTLPKPSDPPRRLKPKALYIAAAILLASGQAGLLLAPSFQFPPGAAWVPCVAGLLLGSWGLLLPKEGNAIEPSSGVCTAALAVISAAWLAWACTFIFLTSCIHPRGSERVFILFDDAMVSLRYAWNLAHGEGLVWNPGERVEGFTNLLQTLLMAVGCEFLGLFQAALFAQVIGVVVVFAAALAVNRLTQEVVRAEDPAHRRLLGAAAFALTLFYYPLNYWSLEGMETGLVAALVLWSLCQALSREVTTGVRVRLSLLLGLAVLSRPDALLLAGLILSVYAARLIYGGHYKAAVFQFALFAILPAAATAFRLSYYGEWVPNTYFLKLTGLDRSIRIASGWAYTRQFLVTVLPLSCLAVTGLLLGFNVRKLVLGILFGVVVVYQVWIGGDAWLYWRFLAPVVPLLFILGLDGVSQIVVHARRILGRGPATAGLGVAVLAVGWGAFVADEPFLNELSFRELPFVTADNFKNLRVALTAKTLVKPGGSCGVTWAGTIPYFSQLNGIDFLGKCDKHIARLPAQMVGFNGMPTVPGHNKNDLNYSIKELKPDVLTVEPWGGEDMADYVKTHYTRVSNLPLRNDSDRVDWDLIRKRNLLR